MGYKARAGEQPVKTADIDDQTAGPAAQSQVEADRRPTILPGDVDSVVEDDGSGTLGGASGAMGGTSGTQSHPDA